MEAEQGGRDGEPDPWSVQGRVLAELKTTSAKQVELKSTTAEQMGPKVPTVDLRTANADLA